VQNTHPRKSPRLSSRGGKRPLDRAGAAVAGSTGREEHRLRRAGRYHTVVWLARRATGAGCDCPAVRWAFPFQDPGEFRYREYGERASLNWQISKSAPVARRAAKTTRVVSPGAAQTVLLRPVERQQRPRTIQGRFRSRRQPGAFRGWYLHVSPAPVRLSRQSSAVLVGSCRLQDRLPDGHAAPYHYIIKGPRGHPHRWIRTTSPAVRRGLV